MKGEANMVDVILDVVTLALSIVTIVIVLKIWRDKSREDRS
jgi:hypothetical protein